MSRNRILFKLTQIEPMKQELLQSLKLNKELQQKVEQYELALKLIAYHHPTEDTVFTMSKLAQEALKDE